MTGGSSSIHAYLQKEADTRTSQPECGPNSPCYYRHAGSYPFSLSQASWNIFTSSLLASSVLETCECNKQRLRQCRMNT